jgi:hypothetical protein
VSTEALVVITASIVKVYETAEAALAAAAAAIEVSAARAIELADRVATDVVLVGRTLVYVTVTVGALAGEAIGSGLVGDVLVSTAHALSDALSTAIHSDGSLADRLHVFTSAAGQNFMAALPALSPKMVAVEQSTLGDLRGLGTYDDLLSTLIADGDRFGLFDDGRPTFVDQAIDPDKLADRRDTALAASIAQTGQSLKTDAEGNIIPTDVSSLFASSSQIDNMGQDDFANIRIFKTVGADGITRYTVQIPSTQSWNPAAGPAPNDLTSDMMAMRYGNNTALSQGVLDAMQRAGITDEPVMLTGFSLGGITAGAVAADPHGYNVQQVVTAGSPIGAMDIPSSTHVSAFESTKDPIAALDGVHNPSSWTTVGGAAPTKIGEGSAPTIADAHDANRYAVMAGQNPAVNDDASVAQFLGGSGNQTTVTDYQVRRDN